MTANGSDSRRRDGSGHGQAPISRRWAPSRLGRRGALSVIGASLVGSLTGCLSGPSFPDADIVAGADSRNIFDPREVAVQVGETVTWGFASAGHNVCCRPDDSDEASLPPAAEAFASYSPGESPEESLVPRGETYEHTFDVPGQYDYVCIPHAGLGMTGTTRVE